MEMGGNEADAFPDLPIQPQILDFHKEQQKIKKHTSKKSPKYFKSGIFVNLLTVRFLMHGRRARDCGQDF